MASLLLETKIYLPKVRRGLVPRPRLGERLNRGAELKLTLVSAPAGFENDAPGGVARFLQALGGVGVAGPERQPCRVVLELPDRGAADG